MTPETRTERPPRRARFQALRTLGTGGHGRVRLVRDLRHGGALRALKTAAPGDDPEARARAAHALAHEARVLSSLRHPGIPHLYDMGTSNDGFPWLLLEYVASAPEGEGAAPEPEPVHVARGLLEVLAYLHRYGWVHYDVKPGNVVVSGTGRVVLLDFGLAVREDVDVPPRGTLPYVAPEVLAEERADRRADLWSAGAVLLRLLLDEDPRPNRTLGPDDVPADSALPADWLRCLLHPRRERRFASAEAALRELDAALGQPPRPSPPRPLPHAPEPAGREVELGRMARLVKQAVGGMRRRPSDGSLASVPGIVLLRGQAGVGKSRVIGEMRLRALERGWTALVGSCSAERHTPLPALGSALEIALADAPLNSQSVRRRGKAVASLLAARSDQDATETAARFLLERAAESRGILLVVEDLQAASALTLRVLAMIARVVAGSHVVGTPARLLAVATLTDGPPIPEQVDETVKALAAEGVLASMPLRPLAPRSVAEMVSGILGPHAPADRVAEILHAHGGALPLFAEELLAWLVNARALVCDDGRWVLGPRKALRMPESLAHAFTTRLKALPAAELRAVQLLATHERPVPDERVERLLDGPAEALLESLGSKGLVSPGPDGASVALAHNAIGQAALPLLANRGRKELHDQVAHALPPLEPSVSLHRAYHVARGTDPDAAIRAATEAARRLRSEGEPGRSADFVRQTLRRLPDGDPRIPHLRRSLADLLVRAARPEAAANVYHDLLEQDDDPWTRVRLLRGLAEALEVAGQTSAVLPVCHEGLQVLEGIEEPERREELVGAHLGLLALLARSERNSGDLNAAIETVKRSLELAGNGRPAERAALMSLLGNVYVQLGELERGEQFHESCLAQCRALGHRRGMATALHNLGVVQARRGKREEAAQTYRQSLRLARRARDLQGVAQTLGNLANLRAERGDFDGAEGLQLRSLALRKRTGDLAGLAVTQGNIAGLKRARGRLGSALTLLHSAVKRLRSLGDAQGEAEFLLRIASLHLFAADPGGARPLLARASSIARGASLRGLEARAEMLWGRLERMERPDGEEWPKRLARAHELHEDVGDPAGLAEVLLETALGERERGRRGLALRAWRAAAELLGEGSSEDLRARADLIRGTLDSDRDPHRPPGTEALEALRRFRAYARSSGRREHRAAAAVALARALHETGDLSGARAALVEAREVEEDLCASLPPALRRSREAGSAGEGLRELARLLERGEDPDLDETAESGTGDDMESERLMKLLSINKELSLATDMSGLIERIINAATEMTGAERGFLILVDDGKIQFQAARNFRREEVTKPELKISSSVVKRVMRSGEPLLTDNATEDQRFADSKSVSRLELKSIVSIPFRLGDEVIGALYLDNPARNGAFGSPELQFLTALADQAALAIRNLRHTAQMAQLNQQLETNLELKSAQLEQASRALADRATRYDYDEIVGRSPQIREMLLLVDKVVDTQVPVLIQGESGTGKELVARAIHMNGKRSAGPLVTVNCGAIPANLMESEFFGHMKGSFTGAIDDKKGLFAAADGGTIFLDEIGEMSHDMQKKLLRVLQERELRPVGGKSVVKIDVRVLSATNKDLRALMTTGDFREDLYYRIAVITVATPPLRDREGDIGLLIEHFIAHAADELGLPAKPFDDDAMAALSRYGWPGNVRELDNEVKKALTLSDERVSMGDLSPQIRGAGEGAPADMEPADGATLKESLERMDKQLIMRALEKTGGNQTRAAKELGISRVWLRKKMERYGLLDSKP